MNKNVFLSIFPGHVTLTTHGKLALYEDFEIVMGGMITLVDD